MALETRRPEGVVHHSGQGSQYTSIAFGNRCRDAGVRPSMGSVGECFDNAMAENFFTKLVCELLDRRIFKTQDEARLAIFQYIEGFYNPRRLHSGLGYLPLNEFEHRYKTRERDTGTNQPADMLAPLKDKPPVAPSGHP